MHARSAPSCTLAALPLLGLLLGLTSVAPTAAGEIGSGIFVGGFVSQGYLNSEDNDYLLPNGREGSGAFNEAAVIVSAEPADRVRVGIQFMGRDFGSSQASAVRVDWAYGDYRWRDQLGLRAGRIKLPYGLYNEERDVDMLRTSVLLPQSVYSESDRNLLLAYEGVGLYGNLVLGDFGDLDYELVLGSLNIPEDGNDDAARLIESLAADFAPAVAADVAGTYGLAADSVSASPASVVGAELAVPRVYGGGLIWNTPLSGLRVGGTWLAGDVEARGRARYDVFLRTGGQIPAYLPRDFEISGELDLEHVYTVSAEFHRGHFTAASEYSRLNIQGEVSDGWYALADYRFSPRLAAQTYWATGYLDADDRDGAKLEAGGLPDYYAWQHDLALALRVDINDFWLVKFEYHHMNGAALSRLDLLDAGETASERWRVWTAKTTFHF